MALWLKFNFMLSLNNNLCFILLCMVSMQAFSSDLTKVEMEAEPVIKIKWDELLPEAFRPDTVIAKYQDQLDKYTDDDSGPEIEALYAKITKEMTTSLVNKSIHNKWIKLPGFIAPLNNDNALITEFLLVPYFGACVHVPPPPTNQTVLVRVADNNGIKMEDSMGAFWISGKIQLDTNKTDIGEAGYSIQDAMIEFYEE